MESPLTTLAGLTSVEHVMHYRYERPVRLGPQIVRLSPTPFYKGRLRSYTLTAGPSNHSVNWLQDPNGNWLARFVFPERVDELRIEAALQVEIQPVNPFDFVIDWYASDWPFAYTSETRTELTGYLATDWADPLLDDFIREWANRKIPTVQLLVEINMRLHNMIRYEVRAEPGVYTPQKTLETASGSCRDIAWLAVQALRRLGFGARFVSGYLLNLTTAGTETDGDGDYSGLHAWVEVYLPGVGWIGLDPTSGTFCNEAYIPLAACVHHSAAAPLTGSLEPAGVTFHHEFHVRHLPPDDQAQSQSQGSPIFV